LVDVADRPEIGRPPLGPRMLDLQERLRAKLGADTDIRSQPSPDGPIIWIKLHAGEGAWWAGFTLPRAGSELPTRVMTWSAVVLLSLLAAAYFFAVRLNRPLTQLQQAVTVLGKGRTPPPLPESGPSEI